MRWWCRLFGHSWHHTSRARFLGWGMMIRPMTPLPGDKHVWVCDMCGSLNYPEA